MPTYDLLFSKDKSKEINEVINCYFLDNETEPATYFPNFNQINIIVGANNSGKSRFMRYLMAFENLESISSIEIVKKLILDYNKEVLIINKSISERIESFDYRAQNHYASNGVNIDKNNADFLRSNTIKHIENFSDFYEFIQDNKVKIASLNKFFIESSYLLNFKKLDQNYYKKYINIKRYYIPTLRTAHSIFDDVNKINNDIFLSTLINNYKLDNIYVDVFTGINLYKEILIATNSEKSVRQDFEKFEKFLRINFFDNKQIDIVAKYVDRKGANEEKELILIHVEGESETRKLYELGDGIQAIIILMYKIFIAKPNSFIFIDEPELNLHPGMQRLFLEQICTNPDLKKKELTYIISTHSNHFLDLTIEKENVSIYSFSPKITDNGEKQFIIKNVNAGDNQLLKNLGVNNSSFFMANCSIWVEGISDRNYIKAFLKSYMDHLSKYEKKNYINLKEDIDFAFFEYAGSNIDHYIFQKDIEKEVEEIILKDINSLALNNRIFLLADSDASKLSEKKGKRLKLLEAQKSENFIPKIIWEVREIENLLTNAIWKEILIEFCNKTLVKTHKEEIQQKIENVLFSLDSQKYSKKYIGEFIEVVRNKIRKISNQYVINRSTYEVKSKTEFGTIINKRELSEIVFEKNFSWEILSQNEEIEKLTIEIYNFILKK